MLAEILFDIVVYVHKAAFSCNIRLSEYGQCVGEATQHSSGCKVQNLTADEVSTEKRYHHDDGHDGQQPVAGRVHLQRVFSLLAQVLRCPGDELAFVL